MKKETRPWGTVTVSRNTQLHVMTCRFTHMQLDLTLRYAYDMILVTQLSKSYIHYTVYSLWVNPPTQREILSTHLRERKRERHRVRQKERERERERERVCVWAR